ncbi:MAG: thioredoxin [Clostridium sp.]|nr:thioredoxin [Clostridium sp.]
MSDFNKFISEDKPTLVDFFATWCGPCKMQAPILEQLKQKMGDTVNILKIDTDRNQDLSAQYQIRSVPTLILFKGGNVVWRASGVHQAADLEAKIKEFV